MRETGLARAPRSVASLSEKVLSATTPRDTNFFLDVHTR